MSEIPRLNGVIKALEEGQTAFVTFAPAEPATAQAIGAASYDGVVFEMEHNPYDVKGLKDTLQYLLNRRQLVERGTLAPTVTPMVRIPPNSGESNWVAKQVLDIGVYGVVWPHVSTVEDAFNVVAACRYPRPPGSARFQPAGLRGDAPFAAATYWGLTPEQYYVKADVWPHDPRGEILVVIMCEEVRAIKNLSKMLKEVPGIGVVLIGEGDLSQDLGHPRQYDHPDVAAALAEILAICKEHNVPCGHPHVDSNNVERLIQDGYRFLMPAPVLSFPALAQGRKAAGRA